MRVLWVFINIEAIYVGLGLGSGLSHCVELNLKGTVSDSKPFRKLLPVTAWRSRGYCQ